VETEKEALAALAAQVKAARAGSAVDSEAFEEALDFLVDEEYEDLCFDLATLVNDAGFGDPAGPKAVDDEQLLRLIHAASESDPNLELLLAASPHCPPDLLETLADSDYEWEEDGTTQMIARATSDVDMLARLGTSPTSSTRFEVARRSITPASVLSSLAEDVDISNSRWYCDFGFPESLIQWAVASNPSTPVETLTDIASGRFPITAEAFGQAHGWDLFNPEDEDEINSAVSAAAQATLGGRK